MCACTFALFTFLPVYIRALFRYVCAAALFLLRLLSCPGLCLPACLPGCYSSLSSYNTYLKERHDECVNLSINLCSFFFLSLCLLKKKARPVHNEPITDGESSPNDDTHRHPAYPQNTTDQSSVTDESSFGSCEPGTSVILQGIVWNETDKGTQLERRTSALSLFLSSRRARREYHLAR